MLKTAAFTWFSKIASAMINFLIMIWLSQSLGAADRGQCGWYLVVVATSLVFSEIVAGSTVIFLLNRYNWKQIRHLYLIWSAIIALAVCSLFMGLGKLTSSEGILLMPLCWFNAGIALQQNLLLGLRKFLHFNILQFTVPLLCLGCLAALFLMDKPSTQYYLWALMGGWGLGFLLAFGMLTTAKNLLKSRVSWITILKVAVREGMVNQAGHVVGLLNHRIVYYILPGVSLGAYSNSLSLAEAMLLVPGSLGQVLYANAAANAKQVTDYDVLRKVVWVNAVLMAISYMFVCLVPESVFTWLFGDSFKGMKALLLILGGGMVFYSFFLVNTYYNSSQGKFMDNLWPLLAGLLASVVGVCWLFSVGKPEVWQVSTLQAGSYLVIFLVAAFMFQSSTGKLKQLASPPDAGTLKRLLRRIVRI